MNISFVNAIPGLKQGAQVPPPPGMAQANRIISAFGKVPSNGYLECLVGVPDHDHNGKVVGFIPHTFVLFKLASNAAVYHSRDGVEEGDYGYPVVEALKGYFTILEFEPEDEQICKENMLTRATRGSIQRMFACKVYADAFLDRRVRFTASHRLAWERAGGEKWED